MLHRGHRYWTVRRYKRDDRPARKWCLRFPLFDEAGFHAGLKSLSYPSKDIRDRKAREIEAEINSPPSTLNSITWPALLAAYDQHLTLRQKGTQISVAATIRKFTQLIAPPTPWAITAAACRQYLHLRTAGQPLREKRRWVRVEGVRAQHVERVPVIPSSSTLAREYRELHALFEWCIREGFMSGNPLANVPCPAALQRQHIAPNPDQWVALLEAVPRTDVNCIDAQALHLLILLAVTTGKRQDILLRLRIRRTPNEPWLELGDTNTHGVALLHCPPSKHSRHDELIGIPAFVADRLAVRISHLPDNATRLFNLTWPRRAWERLQRAVHYEGTFHGLRGASATATAVRRATEEASGLIGHHSTRVTQKHYLEAREIVVAAAAKWRAPVGIPALPAYPAADPPPRRGRPPRDIESRA